jgi:hypothetical protein
MDFFEPADENGLMEAVLAKCEMLAESAGEAKEQFHRWFSAVASAAGNVFTLAFYGKTVYGAREEVPSDVDVLFFISDLTSLRDNDTLGYNLVSYGKPSFIHPHFLYAAGTHLDTAADWKRFCVVNNLLVIPREPDDSFTRNVELGRKFILEAHFSKAGWENP